MKNFRQQIKRGEITEELLGVVVFSLNRGAKKEGNVDMQLLYKMKVELLSEFFTPNEIHLLNGIEHLYYEVEKYKFHVPHELLDYRYSDLNLYVMDRENPPKRRKMSCLSLKFCQYFYNNKNRLRLVS